MPFMPLAVFSWSIAFDAVHERDDGGDVNAKYNRELAALTAAGWRSQLK